MEKILLDTDIGSDIDDAVCLAYLLMQPECELMGITTVLGETDDRCRLASALCYAAGRISPCIPARAVPYSTTRRLQRSPNSRGWAAGRTARIFRRGNGSPSCRIPFAAIPAKSHCWRSAR